MRFTGTEHTVPTVATLTAATLGLGIALAILGPIQDPRSISPTGTATQQVVAQLQEDDPGWDCNTMGNRVCGDPDQVHATEAWKAWDAGQGWRMLRVDASRPFRVVYVGTATLSPKVPDGSVAVPAMDGWYVFRAVPAAPAMDTITAPTPTNALD